MAQWVKNLPAVKERQETIPGSGRSPREGNCRRAWWATVHGVAKSQTRLSLSMMRMHLDN